jgi:cytochrome c6
MKKIILLTVAAFIVALTSTRAADAKENWEKNCLKCHGPDGKGQTKLGKKAQVKDLTDPKVQGSLTDEKAFKSIKDGIKDGEKVKMQPVTNLTDDDIKALVSYLRSFKK